MAEKNVPTDEMTPSELVALGKRNMACHDVNNAITCYARACSKIAKEQGPLSTELAEPSYLYGRALLEIARLEASVLGGKLPEEEPESSSDEESGQSDVRESEPISNQEHDVSSSSSIEGSNQKENNSINQEECCSNNQAEGSVNQTSNSNDQEEKLHQKEILYDQGEGSPEQENLSHDQEQSSHDQGKGSCDQKEISHDQVEESHKQEEGSLDQKQNSHNQEGLCDKGKGSCNPEENQEVTGLQLAWEVLELSRVILSRQDTKEAKLRVADIMATLGEIGLESDMFEQAIKDFTASLEVRESLLPNHDRSIAELHFQLGLAYTLVKDYDSAIQAYQKAKNTLKGTIEHLRSLSADSNVTGTQVESYHKELNDLEELLPDLDSKIEDVSDAKRQVQLGVVSCLQDEAGSSSSFGASSSGFGACSSASVSKAPATDISHLVRKRPVAKDSTQPDNDPKRKKADTSSAADNTATSEQ